MSFRALLVEKDPENRKAPATSSVRSFEDDALASEEPDSVTVDVEFSSVNYKDGLAVLGKPGVVRKYPIVPGIDFVGRVRSAGTGFSVGDRVVLTGWGVGETRWGGFSERARVPASMLLALPEGLDARASMVAGTAGLTAALCVLALERDGVRGTEENPVLVTGAAGGVGSFAVALLAARGHIVTASSGRAGETAEWLTELGARTVVGREFSEPPKGPLGAQRWSGAVDSVGGQALATLLSQVHYGGTVAACGLAGGADLPTTVLPFILRGVSLAGIDSVMCPLDTRAEAWKLLAGLDGSVFERIGTEVVGLGDVPGVASRILKGQVQGRVVVDTSK